MEKDKDLDNLVEDFFNPKKKSVSLDELVQLIEEEMDNFNPLLVKEEQVRFSTTIAIPRLTPSEAFGDPDSQSRDEINKIFSAITGGQDIKARIESINRFLSPESAKRKRSPRVIINMMMIVEALQATLNDYNESAAGFVFEGFMAALTGGKQIAGRVAGTLPIEDFVAFSEFGSDQPVSLKLLSGKTPVKGSFTNIVDFLLVRGAPAIKYLVAYKLTSSKSGVEKLNIFAFDITRENFVDFIVGSAGASLFNPYSAADVKEVMNAFAADPEGNLPEVAKVITKLSGYQRAGLLNKYVETGELPRDKTPEEEEKELAAADERSQTAYLRTLKTSDPERFDQLMAARKERRKREKEQAKAMNESLDNGESTLNEGFHFLEKSSLITEGSESQWMASLAQLETMSDAINWQSFGELDLSQSNINELTEIYSDILGDQLRTLLENTKDLTENIGTYYAAKRRSKAQAAGRVAEKKAEDIKTALEEDPRYKEKQ